MTPTPTIPRHHLIGLACLLLGVYILLFVGETYSVDENSILAVTTTFVRHGEPHIESIAAYEWHTAALDFDVLKVFGVDNAYHAKKGVLTSVLLVPLVAFADLFDRFWATIPTALLLNPILTTLTALLLAQIGVRLGFPRRASLTVAALFGLGTLALPYTQTLFGKPATAFLLTASVLAVLRYQAKPGYKWALVAGVCSGLTIAINTIFALFVPIVGLWLLGLDPRRWRWWHAWAFALPTLAVIAALGGYNYLRFGDPFNTGYNLGANEGFIHPIHEGVFGLLFSSYRGYFVYTPLALLSLFGWGGVVRANRGAAITFLLLILANVLGFASWWSWHGGIVWGPRFMVPVEPLFAVFWLPIITRAWDRPALWWGIAPLAAVSGFVGLLGALFNYTTWPNDLLATYPGPMDNVATGLDTQVMFDPRLSAVYGHFTYLLAGQDFKIALAQKASGLDAVIHILLVIGLLVGGVSLLYPALQRAAYPLGVLALASLLALPVLYPSLEHERAQALARAIPDHGIVYTMTSETWLEKVGDSAIVSAHAPTDPDHPFARTRWDRALAWQPAQPFYLLTWFPPADAANWQEQTLWRDHAFVSAGRANDNRLLRFDRRPVAPTEPHSIRFGGVVTATGYGITPQPDGVSIALAWQLDTVTNISPSLFVHLLGPDGTTRHQFDGVPLGGYAPVPAWQPDETVITRFFAPVTDAVAVRVGWALPDGTLLPVQATTATDAADDFVVIPIPDLPN